MNADKVLEAIFEAEDMCYHTIDFCLEIEFVRCEGENEVVPATTRVLTESRLYSIMSSLNFEYNAVELDNEEDIERVHGYAVAVLREASSTLAKMKALAQAYKQEIEYCDFA